MQVSTSSREPYDSRKATGHVGLVNMGCTCYLNSLLQLLFHISYFRSAVFKISQIEPNAASAPAAGSSPNKSGDGEKTSTIPEALQELFYQMQERKTAPEPRMLTDAFQWDERDLIVQHDIQELATLLRDNLEGKMKSTPAEGTISRLFEGYGENVVETLDRTFTSRRKDIFYDIHLPLGKKYKDVYDSLRSLTAKDQLVGDNKYKVEEEGKPAVMKDAEMGYRFTKFPPVIFFHLKRFEMDMMSPTLEMKKVNTALEFPTTLDLREFENGTAADDEEAAKTRQNSVDGESFTKDSQPIYDLHGVIVHRGTVRVGHYYCYIRKYNAKTEKFEDWYEYDDDTVRRVDEMDAVDNNFGGFKYHTVNGYSQQFPKTHNAYILSYVRRADAPKLMRPTPTDLIPKHIVSKFKQVMEQDEIRRKEEERRNRSCTFVVVTDDQMAAHTTKDNFDLMAKEQKNIEAHTIMLDKTEPFVNLFHRLQEETGTDADNMRLWRWKYQLDNRRAYRPDKPLGTFDDVTASTSVDEVVRPLVGKEEEAKGWRLVLYMEEKRQKVPCPATNATLHELASVQYTPPVSEGVSPMQAIKEGPFGLKLESQTEQYPRVSLQFKKPMPVDFILARVAHNKHRSYTANFQCQLFHKIDDQRPVLELGVKHTLSNDQSSSCLKFEFNTKQEIQMVTICRLPPHPRMEPFSVAKVHVHVPPSTLPNVQPRTITKPILAPLLEKSYMFFIKFYNHKTGTISYVGTVSIDSREPIKNAFPQIYHLLGLGEAQAADFPLMCFDETRPLAITPLDPFQSSHTNENNLINGNIIIVQKHPSKIPLVYRHPRVDHFVKWHDNRANVTVRNVAQPDVIAAVLLMQYNWKHASVVEWIGEKLGIDAERIRLFGNRDFVNAAPREDPERSDSKRTLKDMLTVNQWPTNDLFFEVLDVKLKQLESLTQIEVRTNNEMGTEAGESMKLQLTKTATVQDVIRQVLGDHPFDRPYSLLFIQDSLIYSHAEATPHSAPLLLTEYVPLYRRCVAEVRPVEFPAPAGAKLQCCAHADNTNINYRYLSTYGSPFLLNIPVDTDINQLQAIFQKAFDIKDDDVVDHNVHGCMLQTEILLRLPDWNSLADAYVTNTENNSERPSHLVFNHKRPKEKPGSRYVASNDPKLRLEK